MLYSMHFCEHHNLSLPNLKNNQILLFKFWYSCNGFNKLVYGEKFYMCMCMRLTKCENWRRLKSEFISALFTFPPLTMVQWPSICTAESKAWLFWGAFKHLFHNTVFLSPHHAAVTTAENWQSSCLPLEQHWGTNHAERSKPKENVFLL